MKTTIHPIVRREDLRTSANVIRRSFRTVAVELGLTRENCPTHPSFQTLEALIAYQKKGVEYFGLFLGDTQVGFAAIEEASRDLYYLERLAVIPEYRHHGYGTYLVEFVLKTASRNGVSRVALGMINEHTVLKNWYLDKGFKVTDIKKFEHLPFMVCFMEKDLIP